MSIKLDLSDANVQAKIAQLPEKMLEYAEEVLSKQCDLIVGIAKVTVNVDTGSLRDSIRKERGGQGMYWRQFRVRAGGYITNPKTGKLVNYAGIVERKHPFLAPAVMMVKATIAEMIRAGVAEEIERNL